ncbi:hypothetical protein D3C87_1944400 [compost metagenome]
MELLATMATVYSAGLMVSAGTWISLCSAVAFAVTVTASEAHSWAAALIVRRASKSLLRMRTDPASMPHSA